MSLLVLCINTSTFYDVTYTLHNRYANSLVLSSLVLSRTINLLYILTNSAETVFLRRVLSEPRLINIIILILDHEMLTS